MIEGGKISADAGLIRATAITALKATLSCQLKYNGSGLAARIAGDAIGADAELPTMATEEFLPSLSRAALERLGSGMGVLPRGKVKDTRAAVIEQARETRVVLPEAYFALSEEEATKFARGYYQYAEGEEDADDEASETNALDDLGGGVGLGDAPGPHDQTEQPHAAAA
jgi:hypothetical protein